MPRSSSGGASTAATADASPRQSKSPSRKSTAAATVDVSPRPSWANPTFALTSMAQVVVVVVVVVVAAVAVAVAVVVEWVVRDPASWNRVACESCSA